MEQKDYYQVLRVSPNAPLEEIRAAYKLLALRYHPDLSSHPQAKQKMQLLNEAYSVLGTPEKRQCYDRERLPKPFPDQVEQRADIVKARRPVRAGRDRKLVASLRFQLKILVWLLFLAIGLFAGSLLTGQVNFLAVLLLVFAAVTVVCSMIIKIRKSVI